MIGSLTVGLTGLLPEFPPFSCKVTNDNSAQLVYSFDPAQYKQLFFHLDKDIVGDIYVRQSDSPNDQDEGKVRIYAHLRASNANILLATTLNSIPHPEDSSVEANVYLELYGRERERTLRWGCLKTDVSILFPWNMTRFESLKIQHRNKGDVDVWFEQYGDNSSYHGGNTAVDGLFRDSTSNNNNHRSYNAGAVLLPAPQAPRVAIDRLDIKASNGNIYVMNVLVANKLKVVSEQGGIIGLVTANRRIEMESKLYTILSLKSNNTSSLDLKASAETFAQISMESPYYGHVAMTTWASFFRPELIFSPEYTFVQQTKTLQTLTGYFLYPDSNGTEPSSPLPRL
ncbi:hypothetical protein BGZ96_012693 [Linnemannia gamsii]|uniref:Uncharacterized protein n=1 Tax=Linnemannia gamsii TaxID=64522 RepID=A0ABQ7KAC9_9FUNG|nr:hypothetical protein BGZ96_012693 [Linnemannia gamsii]